MQAQANRPHRRKDVSTFDDEDETDRLLTATSVGAFELVVGRVTDVAHGREHWLAPTHGQVN
ncbi:MAG TPA: hypothetical protein VFS83_18565 [Ktedonobacterales bacterium]|nr:hypothetical protein [Ktedonobacterales bacterium]